MHPPCGPVFVQHGGVWDNGTGSSTRVRALAGALLGGVMAAVLAHSSLAAVPADATDRWGWPLEAPAPIVRPFEAPATPFAAGHRGVDLAAGTGAEVLAPAAGVVYFAGWVVDRPVLSIAHPGGYVTSFEPVDAVVAEGEAVTAGQPVGTLAAGAHCLTGPCLHFGLRLHGEYISPLSMLGGIPRSILLPLGQ